jgi:hypothetical protein
MILFLTLSHIGIKTIRFLELKENRLQRMFTIILFATLTNLANKIIQFIELKEIPSHNYLQNNPV